MFKIGQVAYGLWVPTTVCHLVGVFQPWAIQSGWGYCTVLLGPVLLLHGPGLPQALCGYLFHCMYDPVGEVIC